MKKTLKQRWIDALRSGDYEQGNGQLCKIDKGNAYYCCLGVLAELVEGSDAWTESQYNNDLYMDRSQWRWYGTTLLSATAASEVASMNDNDKTFKQIATYIEGNVTVKEPSTLKQHTS